MRADQAIVMAMKRGERVGYTRSERWDKVKARDGTRSKWEMSRGRSESRTRDRPMLVDSRPRTSQRERFSRQFSRDKWRRHRTTVTDLAAMRKGASLRFHRHKQGTPRWANQRAAVVVKAAEPRFCHRFASLQGGSSDRARSG
jgi:hypothetical protein